MLIAVFFAASAVFSSGQPVGPLLGPVPVLRVLDGDTVVLESNLGPRIVRLIGIDAPETTHPEAGGKLFAAEASSFAQDLLTEGSDVWVELDLETVDAYGRLLAYLYNEDPLGEWLIEGSPARMVNLAIARAGFARIMTIEPNSVYADLFEDAVESAQIDGLGIWSARGLASMAQATGGVTMETSFEGLPPGDIVIACTLYDPATPNDTNAETVTIWVRTAHDTRGYLLYDKGSGTRLRLPPGEHGPGPIVIKNPHQGIWNNSGDTIYLMRGEEVVDSWDYTDRRAGEGIEICRHEP